VSKANGTGKTALNRPAAFSVNGTGEFKAAKRTCLVTGFVYGLLNRFTGFPGPFLNSANQLIFSSLFETEIIIRQACPFLFQLPLGNIPIALHLEFIHLSILSSFGF
jgi:hypothetical protein